MRILYFADTRFPIERANGVQTMATCHALAARGHDVRLVVRRDSATPARDPFTFYDWPRLDTLRIETLETPDGVRARRAAFLFRALRMAASRDGDIVYTRDLGLAALLVRIPRGRRTPVIYESHGVSVTVSEEMPRLLGRPDTAPSRAKLDRLDRRERRVWRQAAAYVTITRALADELAERYGPRENVFVVPDGAKGDGASSEVDKRRTTSEVAPITAAYAGHLYPWKGVDVFVGALALAPGIRGLIVGGHPGEADLARVRQLVADLALGDRVTITGLVEPGEVTRRLAQADILVLPNTPSAISERYTSPLKLFEYLTMGLPIVASDLASIREIVTHEATALMVRPGDAADLAAALQRLAQDRQLAQALGDAARRLAESYTWTKRAERLEAALAAATRT